jgi:hypothetical protein
MMKYERSTTQRLGQRPCWNSNPANMSRHRHMPDHSQLAIADPSFSSYGLVEDIAESFFHPKFVMVAVSGMFTLTASSTVIGVYLKHLMWKALNPNMLKYHALEIILEWDRLRVR